MSECICPQVEISCQRDRDVSREQAKQVADLLHADVTVKVKDGGLSVCLRQTPCRLSVSKGNQMTELIEREAAVRCNLEAIVVRCRDGSKDVDWLPTIERLATEALAALPSIQPAASERFATAAQVREVVTNAISALEEDVDNALDVVIMLKQVI